MAVGGARALLIGWMTEAPFALVLSVALVCGFAVVSDPAQFSAVVTGAAPSHAVGTALAPQTSLGFLLTKVTIQGVPSLREAVGWPITVGASALGPAAGILAMRRLDSLRSRAASSTRDPIPG